MIGVTRASISMYETSKANPSYKVLGRLAEVLAIPFAELAGLGDGGDDYTGAMITRHIFNTVNDDRAGFIKQHLGLDENYVEVDFMRNPVSASDFEISAVAEREEEKHVQWPSISTLAIPGLSYKEARVYIVTDNKMGARYPEVSAESRNGKQGYITLTRFNTPDMHPSGIIDLLQGKLACLPGAGELAQKEGILLGSHAGAKSGTGEKTPSAGAWCLAIALIGRADFTQPRPTTELLLTDLFPVTSEINSSWLQEMIGRTSGFSIQVYKTVDFKNSGVTSMSMFPSISYRKNPNRIIVEFHHRAQPEYHNLQATIHELAILNKLRPASLRARIKAISPLTVFDMKKDKSYKGPLASGFMYNEQFVTSPPNLPKK
uniref:HTH cro/C1-type domain-containing protein n=1 Tax=Tanacetum cinerariifolium TaxID=118510 RepID=A0A699JBI3_TANCI|nr:hypothetical protein [Tanacetum cinerariifolium]